MRQTGVHTPSIGNGHRFLKTCLCRYAIQPKLYSLTKGDLAQRIGKSSFFMSI